MRGEGRKVRSKEKFYEWDGLGLHEVHKARDV